ncbi:EamA-like transporter family protein [Rhizobiales bacterium GAS113]|nr:EamA-like transporter family protein [Rhizobiales bacterium GAS113]
MDLVLFAAICLIWGATWLALKFGLAVVPPLIFAGTRFVVAGAAFLIFLRLRGEPMRIHRSDWLRLAIVTLTLVVGCYALLFWGTLYVSSGLSAILNLATMPVALLTIGIVAGEESFGARRAVAILCGVVGLIMLFAQRIVGPSAGSFIAFLGAMACAGSAIVYAFGSVMARPLLRRYSTPLISGLTTLFGGCVLTLISLGVEPGGRAALDGDWGLMAWLGWLFLVLFGSLCAFTMYMQLVRDWGPSRAGTYAFVSPIVAVLLGSTVLGERLTLLEGLGMVAMLAGAWLSLVSPKPRPVAASAAPVRSR